jgi:hypothetical protein
MIQTKRGKGFSSLDIAEAVGEIRGRSLVRHLRDKDKTSSDVRRSWQKLQATWRRKEEGVRQRFRDGGISLRTCSGQGGGRWDRADVSISPRLGPRQTTGRLSRKKSAQDCTGTRLRQSHIRYVCEDIDDAGWLARLFANEYRLIGWKRWLITLVVAIPVLATFFLFIAMLFGTTNWSRVGTPLVLQVELPASVWCYSRPGSRSDH